MVEAVDRIPVVGNGDLRTLEDVAGMFADTGCAAVSIGRGALSNPYLFRQLAHWADHGHPGPEPTFEERVDTMPTTSTASSTAAASGWPASSSAR